MSWREDFEKRCRRLVGVRDDAVAVELDVAAGGECETCDYGAGVVTVSAGGVSRDFDDLGALIRELDDALVSTPAPAPQSEEEDEHAVTYSWPHPDLFRADCSCGWVRASPDRSAVEAAVDRHEKDTSDGIDWAEVARSDREQQDGAR